MLHSTCTKTLLDTSMGTFTQSLHICAWTVFQKNRTQPFIADVDVHSEVFRWITLVFVCKVQSGTCGTLVESRHHHKILNARSFIHFVQQNEVSE